MAFQALRGFGPSSAIILPTFGVDVVTSCPKVYQFTRRAYWAIGSNMVEKSKGNTNSCNGHASSGIVCAMGRLMPLLGCC